MCSSTIHSWAARRQLQDVVVVDSEHAIAECTDGLIGWGGGRSVGCMAVKNKFLVVCIHVFIHYTQLGRAATAAGCGGDGFRARDCRVHGRSDRMGRWTERWLHGSKKQVSCCLHPCVHPLYTAGPRGDSCRMWWRWIPSTRLPSARTV